MSVTKLVVEPLLSFVTKVSYVFHLRLFFSLFAEAVSNIFNFALSIINDFWQNTFSSPDKRTFSPSHVSLSL